MHDSQCEAGDADHGPGYFAPSIACWCQGRMTYEAHELARLPVPGSEGFISMQVRTQDGRVRTGETRWFTISFEQFARIQNVLDNQL